MDRRPACLVEVTGRAPEPAFPFKMQHADGTMTVSVSGFAIADRILVCAGAVFSKFEPGYVVVAVFSGCLCRVNCEILAIDYIPALEHYVNVLTNEYSADWRVGWNDTEQNYSQVAILKTKDIDWIPPTYTLSTADLAHGEIVRIVSSPFGAQCRSVFHNSVTAGCVFNIANNSDVMVIDTRCLPGSEGAVMLDQEDRVVGMLALFIFRLHDSVALSIAVNSSILLQLMRKHCISGIRCLSHRLPMSPYRSCERYLACVRVGNSWCTAVIVHQNGYLLTNAHLFFPYMDNGTVISTIYVQIRSCNLADTDSSDFTSVASLVYISQGPWDVALIKIDKKNRLFSVMDNARLSKASTGMEILVVGFSVFRPDCFRGSKQRLGPSASRGVVSNVVTRDGHPIMIQSSATVHSGNSGGALVDAKTGALLGLVTSNARQMVSDTENIVIPRMNFSIPAWVVAKCIEYSQSRDKAIILELDSPDEAVDQIWSLSNSEGIRCKL